MVVNRMPSQNSQINMIKQQLRTGDVLDETILTLFETVLRQEFVPSEYKNFAYSDMQIPLNHHQRMMTPLEEGKLLQALELKGHETVLEVGTGSGFLTALLSRLAKKVISVDYFTDFTEDASRKLNKFKCHNVELITADASRGWLEKAPYDIMVFTGAITAISDTQRLQILPGGKLFAIVGKVPAMQGQLHSLDRNGQWHAGVLFETSIPPLIDKLEQKKFVF